MKIFQKITAVFLAGVFLLSSLGFTINKMICVKSGKEKLSLVNIEDCCKSKQLVEKDDCCDEETENHDLSYQNVFFTKSDCCNILNTYFDLSDFHTAKNSFVPQVISYDLFFTSDVQNVLPCQSIASTTYHFSPPPISYGRGLLSQISVLII